MGRLPLLTLLVVVMKTRPVRSRDDCLQLLEEDHLQTQIPTELMFLPRTPSLRPTCLNQHQELLCCPHNFRTLRWYRYDVTSQSWADVKLSSIVYHLPEGDPRKLVLERPVLADSGWYRCSAANDVGQEISHNISLLVQECAAMNHPPVLSSPPEDILHRQPGSAVSLTCQAYFGTDYKNDRLSYLIWNVETVWENGSLAGKDVWIPSLAILPQFMPADPRIQLNISMLNDGQISTLTIDNVTVADYGNYSCHARNSIGWSEMMTIVLRPGDPSQLNHVEESQPDTLGLVLSQVLGVGVGVAILIGLVWFIWRKPIQLLYKDNIAKPRNPDAVYDALVIHSPGFGFTLETLLPCLEDKYGYHLCVPERDFVAGPDLADVIVDNIHLSQALLFVITEAMLQQEWCDFVFQYVAAREYTNLVFIILEPIGEDAWHPNQAALKNVINTHKHVVRWPSKSPDRAENVWQELRLALPPKLRNGNKTNHWHSFNA